MIPDLPQSPPYQRLWAIGQRSIMRIPPPKRAQYRKIHNLLVINRAQAPSYVFRFQELFEGENVGVSMVCAIVAEQSGNTVERPNPFV